MNLMRTLCWMGVLDPAVHLVRKHSVGFGKNHVAHYVEYGPCHDVGACGFDPLRRAVANVSMHFMIVGSRALMALSDTP
jgi:hypothetical protein